MSDEMYPGANEERARLHERQAEFDAELTEAVSGRERASRLSVGEATLREALERLVASVTTLQTVDDDGETADFWTVPPEPLELARAALVTPAPADDRETDARDPLAYDSEQETRRRFFRDRDHEDAIERRERDR